MLEERGGACWLAVMGDLADLDVASLLQMLGGRRATGRLRITAAGDEVGLYLRQGRLVLATSVRLPLRLGRVLQRRGVLTTRQLHTALRLQAEEGRVRSLGDILVARGWVTPGQLSDAIEEQGVAALTRVLATEEGTFVYEPGVALPFGVAPARLDAGRLLLEATRRVDELVPLRKRLPHPHAPLAPSARIDVTAVTLNPAEQQLIAVLRAGAGSLAELIDLLPVDEPDLMRMVLDLIQRGLLVGGHGAPGAGGGIAAPPPTEADLIQLFPMPGTDELDDALRLIPS